MNERPEPPPEGRLIALAQKRARLSGRKAADRAGMSEGHWRAIVSGSRSIAKDTWVPVRGPAETLARMAHVVGVTAEQLDQAGRPDAADALREGEPAREETLEEIQAEISEDLARLRAKLTTRLDDRNQVAAKALIDGLEAIVEGSTPGRE